MYDITKRRIRRKTLKQSINPECVNCVTFSRIGVTIILIKNGNFRKDSFVKEPGLDYNYKYAHLRQNTPCCKTKY